MRKNLPITQKEFPFPRGQTIVSVTDAKGRITYANAAFVSVSGYSLDELLGQPHNIVRHPDMPEEAFRDLWATIESGLPWQGLVKNRRKDGDHYWVLANATPLRVGNRIVGYLSVRSEPTREQIAQAEALYAKMRAEEEAGRLRTGLHRGRVVRATPLGRAWDWIREHHAATSLGGVAMLSAVMGTAIAAVWLPATLWVPLGVALTAAAGWVRNRQGAARMQRLVDDALQLAAGDLTHQPATGAPGLIGMLQLALWQVAMNLRAVVGDVRDQVTGLRGAVAEIAAGNKDMSARTEAQAASLQQTAAAMEQINGTVRNTAAHAAEGGRLAADTAQVAERSRQAVQAAVQAMQGIHDSSRRIGDIIQVIEGVAFQTNILALNAAVEAARAGEAGRGFAVVAAEVRTLAQRTGEAAREIRQLITEATGRVAAGVQQTDAAQAATEQALEAVARVATLLTEIDNAAREQQLGVSQINEAVTHLDGVTQQNAAMVEQLAAAAQTLSGQVDQVANSMRLFRLREDDTTVAEADAVTLRREAKAAIGAAAKAASGGDFLDQAVAAHMQWKAKLRNAIDRGEKLDEETICRDDRCALGQWLHGEGRGRWGHVPQFSALVEKHAAFHRHLGDVARVVNAGRRDEARRMLDAGTAYSRATQATVMAIKALQQVVRGGKSGGGAAPTTAAKPVAGAPAKPQPATAGGDDWQEF